MKLHQLLAVMTGLSGEHARQMTKAAHRVQKRDLFDGLSRTYKADTEGGDQYPPESKKVQETVASVLAGPSRLAFESLLDGQMELDAANALAKADVMIGQRVLVKDAPVTYLLWLEKRVADLRAFAEKLPVLDPAKDWVYDENRGFYVTQPVETAKEKRWPKVLVKYDATDKHPAQTELIDSVTRVGAWSLTEFSGAMPEDEKRRILERLTELAMAVKLARETANQQDVASKKGNGKALLDFVFTG